MPTRHCLRLGFLHVVAEIDCDDEAMCRLLQRIYDPLQVPRDAPPTLRYRIQRRARGYRLERDGAPGIVAEDRADLLYCFDKDFTIALQLQLPQLYFLHAAALVLQGRAILLVAPSGSGKSTTTWGLVHHGLGYLSDELAPVDPITMRVMPFPRALCLKSPPPRYPLPPRTIRTSRTLHVAPADLPVVHDASLKIGAIVFVSYRPELDAPAMARLSTAEAAARLYSNGLNQLSHPGDGLPDAVRICGASPCFALGSADLAQTARLLVRQFGENIGVPA